MVRLLIILTLQITKNITTLVGWILTIRKLGDIFNVNGFRIWNYVMTIVMCITWLVLFVLTAVAFWEGKIFNSNSEDVLRDMYVFKLERDQKRQVQDIERRLTMVERHVRRATIDAGSGAGQAVVVLPMPRSSEETEVLSTSPTEMQMTQLPSPIAPNNV